MDPWEEIQFHWNRAFASLSGYGPPRFGFFTDNLTLSGPVTLGEDPVMAVESSDRQYWRALNFDAYTGRGWQNTDPEEVEVEASSTLPRPLPYDEREELVQTVQLYRSGEKVVFGANEISSVNREATARLVYVPPITQAGEEPPEEGAGEYGQISILASKLRFRRDEVYEAVSYVSTASPSMLREAGEAYPEWVLDRYLQLPEELPERITELTERLTTPYDNAYDKASAVQAYLREIEYNESIDAPPPGVDAVDWFLFDNRQGYCDYYSSAMAVMLRTIGIPTRVSRGYAAGQFYEETETYLVRELDAHAWPEIYFPRYGWIEFEPTASEPLLTRPEEDEASAAGAGPANLAGYEELEDDLFPEEDEMMNAPNTPWRPVETAPWWQRTDWMVNLVPLIPILLGGALIWYLRRRRLAANTLVTVAFDNMLRYTRWLGIELRPNHTPYECAAALTAYANEGRKDAYYIADLYVQEHYSGKEITVYDEMNAMDAWRRLRRTLQAYLVAKLLPLKPEVAENLRSAMAPEPTSS
jgi:transglutaminase-like putative cysteine protease